jgi:hypothetical protein
MRYAKRSLVKAAVRGAAAGALGTAAMDLVEFRRYRLGGGTERLIAWETAEGVKKWEDASAPGQLGKRVAEGITGRELSDRWARSTTNLVHWATGLGWGAQFGLLDGVFRRHRFALSALLGPTAWLTGYVILPFAKVYKPIWEYDAATLTKDLSAHLAYGSVTAAGFGLLARRNGKH